MSDVIVYSLQGEEVGKVALSKSIFHTEVNRELLSQAVHVYLRNQREFNANTKVRSEIRGGGRKPWKQKGTGRARQGSTRSAQWRGGAMVFGPRSVDRQLKKMPRSMAYAAMRSALSLKVAEKALYVLRSTELEQPNTKLVLSGLRKFLQSDKPFFYVDSGDLNLRKSLRNVEGFLVGDDASFNVYTILNTEALVVTEAQLKKIEKRLQVKEKAAPKSTDAEVAAEPAIEAPEKAKAKSVTQVKKAKSKSAAVKPAVKTARAKAASTKTSK